MGNSGSFSAVVGMIALTLAACATQAQPAPVVDPKWLALLAGARPEAVVHQCGSGVSACHSMLAMEIAGLPGSRLYAGSWSEWCADPARPVVRP